MPSPPNNNIPWLYCLSAPTSPNRASEFYQEFDDIPMIDQTDEFAFHVSQDATKSTVSAAELFHAGKIRPLEPLASDPYHEAETTTSVRSPLLSSSTSPKSSYSKEDPNVSKGRKTFWSAFTPKMNKPTNNPRVLRCFLVEDEDDDDDDDRSNHRGRGRAPSSTASIRRGTRSLSPIRLPNYLPWEDDEDHHHRQKKEPIASSALLTLLQKPSKSSRMRKLKNFLLFRSASEGRASDKLEPLNKFAAFHRNRSEAEEMPCSSSKNIRRTAVSAHEKHYAMKKAASEDLKKKTFLPYKRGILGR